MIRFGVSRASHVALPFRHRCFSARRGGLSTLTAR